jgi:hypothetical protein
VGRARLRHRQDHRARGEDRRLVRPGGDPESAREHQGFPRRLHQLFLERDRAQRLSRRQHGDERGEHLQDGSFKPAPR